MRCSSITLVASLCGLACVTLAAQQAPSVVPKTWAPDKLATLELPSVLTGKPTEHVSAEFYYSIPATTIYRTYPVYHPDHEPEGYLEDLRSREPERTFDAAGIRTEEDWQRAGAQVFAWPIAWSRVTEPSRERMRGALLKIKPPITTDGVLPFRVYVVREKGRVEIGSLSCAQCHTRVMPDGSTIVGAQGNYPFDHFFAEGIENRPPTDVHASAISLFGTPETEGVAAPFPADLTGPKLAAALRAIPPGVMARHGTSAYSPVQIPDLIGVENRRYLDRTGLHRHRDIGDMMRYAALNQDLDRLGRWGTFQPATAPLDVLPDDALPPDAPSKDEIRRQIQAPENRFRYSDAHLYALAKFLYALQPPKNHNPSDALSERGRKVFEAADCKRCHPAPHYTSNQLTPAEGFRVPATLRKSDKIRRRGVGTDARLTTTTRRGTGFYKVPSLLGVWYRGPFSHDGSVATLEDWFDPRRVDDDYVPTGWNPEGKPRAVPGHDFGLDLDAEERRALIAFLRTL